MAGSHPIVVHFAIAGLLVGVAFRWLALVVRPAFAGPAAAALVAIGALAATAAVATGEEARVAAEGVPGVAALVRAHATWGVRARNLALGLAALEGVALVRPRAAVPAAIWGLAVAGAVLQAGRHGGDLVYARAAGVGVRSGDPADVGWLLLAGLHRQADLDRRAGRPADAAELLTLAARRFGGEPGVQIEAAESALDDRRDAGRALALARATDVPRDEPGLRFRRGWIESRALEALGDADGARAALVALGRDFPDSARVRRRLAGEAPGHE